MKKKVYIASPYTNGDVGVNVKRQLDMADRLLDLGFIPFVPLLIHYLHISHPRDYDEWLQYDIEWLLSCDYVLRLEGVSRGADKEVEIANFNNILVFYSLSELAEYENSIK